MLIQMPIYKRDPCKSGRQKNGVSDSRSRGHVAEEFSHTCCMHMTALGELSSNAVSSQNIPSISKPETAHRANCLNIVHGGQNN